MAWQRPDGIPFPQVWHRFHVKDPNHNTASHQQYVVQDLPEDRFDDAIRHMCDHFARDELLNRAKGLAGDVDALQAVIQLWKGMLPERLSLVCFAKGSEEIVGVNILGVLSKEDEDEAKFDSDLFQDIYDTIGYVSQQADIFNRYSVDHYLNAMGLSVDPRYRRRGVATELLRARIALCRAVGLRLTSTCFTGPESQRAAAKVGFKEDFSVTYRELAQLDARFVYPGIEDMSCKNMSLWIE